METVWMGNKKDIDPSDLSSVQRSLSICAQTFHEKLGDTHMFDLESSREQRWIPMPVSHLLCLMCTLLYLTNSNKPLLKFSLVCAHVNYIILPNRVPSTAVNPGYRESPCREPAYMVSQIPDCRQSVYMMSQILDCAGSLSIWYSIKTAVKQTKYPYCNQ